MVLVNSCLTQEISIQMGLKQGDCLAHFLFLLVAKGLSGLISRVVNLHLFSCFRVGSSSDLVVSHIQYADETIIVTDAYIDNLWAIKAILRGFERASSLKVNFSKSNLIGVNFGSTFLDLACDFLHCNRESPLFKYTVLHVGANPRIFVTWEPLVNLIIRRIHS